MKAYIDIKFDREIDKDVHYISPGGYEVNEGDKTYAFDFNEFEGVIDKNDATILHCYLRDEDIDSYPDIEELKKHFAEITELTECFVYTGEDGDPEIVPTRVEAFAIESWCLDVKTIPADTEFVTCKKVSEVLWDEVLYPVVQYSFTRKLLDGNGLTMGNHTSGRE